MSQGRRTVGRLARLVLAVVAIAVTSLGGAGTAAAAPGPVPGPASQITEARLHAAAAARHAPRLHRFGTSASTETGTRAALAVPAGTGDDAPYVLADPGCVSRSGGTAEPDVVVGSATTLKVDYVLTGTGDYRATGTFKVKADRETSLGLKAVPLGSYHLTLTRHGDPTVIGDVTFGVLPCVQVQAACHAVTFTNPAGNPTARVSYVGHKKKQTFDVDVAPGSSTTVRADYASIDYLALGFDDTGEQQPARLGEKRVSVKQHCSVPPAQPGSYAVQSSASVGCSQAGATAYVFLEWSVQPSVKKTRYTVVADAIQATVAAKTFSGGKRTTLRLAPGSYHYRSYANGLAAPFEDVAFSVLDCVQVTPVCRALEVDNPNAVALDVFVLGFDEDDESAEPTSVDATAAPSTTTTVAWRRPSAFVYVSVPGEDPDSRFVNDTLTPDLGYGDVELEVPQDC